MPDLHHELAVNITLQIFQDSFDIRYILATENMKVGDLIKTSSYIPRIPGK